MVRLETLEARNGLPTLRALKDGNQPVFLNSAYEPEGEADRWLTVQDLGNSDLLVLFGLGMGYHLKALLQRAGAQKRIIVIEPNAETVRIVQSAGYCRTALNAPNVRVAANWAEFRNLFEEMEDPWINARLFVIPSYLQVYPAEFQSFAGKLHQELNALRTRRQTILHFSKQWQENFFRNLRFLGDSGRVASGFGLHSGKPAIIVSSGPSLEKNIQDLKEATDKALIIAAGSSIRALAAADIRPDLVVALDAGAFNYEARFKDLCLSGIPLVYDIILHPAVVENHAGPRVAMLTHKANGWLEKYFGPIGLLELGPSVANTAMDLAWRLGADPIVLVGQDLAFTDEKSHAGSIGQVYHLNHVRKDALAEVEGVDGRPVATTHVLLTHLHWFQERIGKLEGGRTFIDATEGGARIEGTQVLSLRETIDRHCRKDLSEAKEELIRELTAVPERPADAFLKFLISARKRYESLVSESRQLNEMVNPILANGKGSAAPGVRRACLRSYRTLEADRHYCLIPYLLEPIRPHLRRFSPDNDHDTRFFRHLEAMSASLTQVFEQAQPLLSELIDALSSQAAEPRAS
jgi:hypothetical protein